MDSISRVLADFVGSNGLQAFIEGGVLLFFWGAVLGAITSSIGAGQVGLNTAIRAIVQAANFNYVATVVAGLVLTAATGALGGKPAQLPPQANSVDVQSSATASKPASSTVNTNQTLDRQKQAFQTICGWSYIGLGILCLIVFVIPSQTTHDLVKTVGLTTLGFAGTIIGGLSQ